MKPENSENKFDSYILKLKQEQCEKLLFRENCVLFLKDYDPAIRRFILCDSFIRGYLEISEVEKMEANSACSMYLTRSMETEPGFKKNYRGQIYVLHIGLTVPLEPPVQPEEIIKKKEFKGTMLPIEFRILSEYVMRGLSCS